MADDPRKPHSLSDHRLGADLAHVHEGEADHDHDDLFDDGPIEDNPLWIADNVTLASVGIDIGSAGTQVIFSKVHLRRLSEDLTSRYYVVGRDTLFRSPVALTPYQSEERIDDAQLRAIIADAYAAAGIAPADVDTGVAAGKCASHRRTFGGTRRRFRLRYRWPSHGGDARWLRFRRGARVVRPG
jgi:ethanolamine utilization protein EutA